MTWPRAAFLPLIALVPAIALGGGPALAAAPDAELPYGTWRIAAQTCPGCTGTEPVADLAGATVSISRRGYSDGVIGTDACNGAPVLTVTPARPFAVAQGRRLARKLAGPLRPDQTRARQVNVSCSTPAAAPYTGKVLARLVYLPPNRLLYLWDDGNVLLFSRGR